jgi:hypothetical protein
MSNYSLTIKQMANITVKDLVNRDLFKEVDLMSFVRDLSEDQINLRGGICAFLTDGTSGGCSDVIIDFPEKFDLSKLIKKRK